MHRIVVNVQTGKVSQIEYTPEELAEHEAKIAEQDKQLNQPTEE